MILDVSATSNIESTVNLICNGKQIWVHHGTVFSTTIEIDNTPKNVLDIQWQCAQLEDVYLKIDHILLNEQKLDINKSMYLPTTAPEGYNQYISQHCGKIVWPGIVRFYFQVIKQNDYVKRKQNETTMIRKYNTVYD